MWNWYAEKQQRACHENFGQVGRRPKFLELTLELLVPRRTFGSGIGVNATATALCCGQDPALLHFEQSKMREHLRRSLELKVLTPFPARPIQRRNPNVVLRERLRLYCICRQPNDGQRMLQCTRCKEWYHTTCMYAPKEALEDLNKSWYCKTC